MVSLLQYGDDSELAIIKEQSAFSRQHTDITAKYAKGAKELEKCLLSEFPLAIFGDTRLCRRNHLKAASTHLCLTLRL
jgi:hypothetical protein